MVAPRSAPVKAEDDSRTRIIAAARAAFSTMGFEGASTRRIALEAGIAQSVVLYHFGTKDALWRAVMDELFGGLEARMRRAFLAVAGGSTADHLMAMVNGFVDLCAESADLHRIMTVEGRQETERMRWLVDRHLRGVHAQATALIRGAQASGSVRPGDPTLLYYSAIAIAGTAFSLAPEIRMVSGDERTVDPSAIADLIRSVLFVGDGQGR